MAVNSPRYDGKSGRIYLDSTGSIGSNTAIGADNDISIYMINAGTGGAQRADLRVRQSGTWSNALNTTDGTKIALPHRSRSMTSSDLLPGWSMSFADAYATGTVPDDLFRSGTFGGAWYSSAAGTRVGFCRARAGNPMAFFSGMFTITTLPEAGRFFYFGQFYTSGTDLFGYGLRLESTGAITLRVIDTYSTVDTALATGMTAAANDTIVLERFGYRMSVAKTATTGRALLGAENATATNRPIHAQLKAIESYATSFAASSFGIATDSASVRVSGIEFAG